MLFRLTIVAVVLTGYLQAGNVASDSKTEALLWDICHITSAVTAEQQLEQRGATDRPTRDYLSQQLPLLLSQTKDVNATVLLAKLAGSLHLASCVPALSLLLSDDKSKPSVMATLYQTEKLINDPVAAALVQIGVPSVRQVSVLLQSPHVDTRSRAVRVLGKIGSTDAFNALRDASKHENDAAVRSLILSELREQPIPMSPK